MGQIIEATLFDHMVAREMLNRKNSETPASNTGSIRHDSHDNGLRYKLDFLTVTGIGDTEELIDIIWAATGCNWDYDNARPGTRGIFYDLILRSSSTIELAIKINRDDVSRNSYRLSIPGKPLGDLSESTLSALGQKLYSFGCSCTRFDWAIDDYDRVISVDWFETQGRLGNYTGTREFGVYYKRKSGQLNDAKTVYFGSFSSEKLLRAYDKNIESRGRINAIRLEGQFRKNLAKIYFNALFHDDRFQENAKIVSNYAIGSIDFIYRENAVVSRCARIDDWSNFCQRVGQAVKISAKRVIRTIKEKMDWVERQVAGTLALCALCIGLDETLAWLERHIRVRVRRISEGSNEFFKTQRDKRIVENLGFNESLKLRRGYDKNQQKLKLDY